MTDLQDKIIVIENVIESYIEGYKLSDHIDDVRKYVDEGFVNEIDEKYKTDWRINSRMGCWSLLFTGCYDGLEYEKLSYIVKILVMFTGRVGDIIKVFAEELRYFITDLADNGVEREIGRETFTA